MAIFNSYVKLPEGTSESTGWPPPKKTAAVKAVTMDPSAMRPPLVADAGKRLEIIYDWLIGYFKGVIVIV